MRGRQPAAGGTADRRPPARELRRVPRGSVRLLAIPPFQRRELAQTLLNIKEVRAASFSAGARRVVIAGFGVVLGCQF